jgi:hypothetical protein
MNSRTKLAMALLVLVAATLAGLRLFWTQDRIIQNKAVLRREIATRVLAENLAQRFAGRPALIVSNPFSQQPGQPSDVYAFETAGIRGLKKGWGQNIRLLGVAYPELSPAARSDPGAVALPPDITTPLSFLTADRAWDALLRQNPGVEILVSLIGLPADLPALELWRHPRLQLALLLPDLRLVGNRAAVKDAIKKGKLAALVLNRPGAPPEQAPLDRDYRSEFEKRFLLITPENVDAALSLYPGLL